MGSFAVRDACPNEFLTTSLAMDIRLRSNWRKGGAILIFGLEAKKATFVVAAAVAAMVGVEALAHEGAVPPEAMNGGEVYSPFVGRDYPDKVLYGDLHFHTEISFDAGLIGTRLTMHDAKDTLRRFVLPTVLSTTPHYPQAHRVMPSVPRR